MATRKRWILRIVVSLVSLMVLAGVALFLLRPKGEQPPKFAAPIQIQSGLLQGTEQGGLIVYKGIPYAAPPVGELRWRAPQPAAPWSETYRADAFKPACMQSINNTQGLAVAAVSEDCLTLNIWAPAQAANKNLAVMVYLHGGGNVSGSGSQRLYWGDQLAKKGVVVVTINYRLSTFGNLAHPELTQESGHGGSGNYSLLDQIAALRWVQDNIAAFGGDPGNVTLFGQSAGAYYASRLMASPLTLRLFKRVIAQSGGDFAPPGTNGYFPMLADAEKMGAQYAEALGASSIAALRAIDADKLLAMNAQPQFTKGALRGVNDSNVDGYVVPRSAYEAIAAGTEQRDLLVGFNADEGANTTGEPLSAAAYIADTRQRYGEFAEKFLDMYPASSDAEATRSQIRLHTADTAWRSIVWARLHAGTGAKNVYLYRFSRVPPFQPFRQLQAAGHGAELPYVFGYPPGISFFFMEAPWQAYRDKTLAGDMQTYWTNFAKTGDPNGNSVPSWPAFGADEKIMEFGATPRVSDLPDQDEIKLMDAYMTSLRKSEE